MMIAAVSSLFGVDSDDRDTTTIMSIMIFTAIHETFADSMAELMPERNNNVRAGHRDIDTQKCLSVALCSLAGFSVSEISLTHNISRNSVVNSIFVVQSCFCRVVDH